MTGIPTNVAQLMAVLSLNAKPFKTEAAGVVGMMGKAGPIAIAALGMGAVVAGVGFIATKMAGDFQAGLNSLVTGAGESQKNLQLVSDGVLQMAKDTGTSTSQLISGLYMIESGGFHGAAGLNILKAAAEGAKVGSADLGTIADTTDTILKNFGEHGTLTATQAVNALITTVANGKTHLEDLGSSLSGVLPAGAAAGLGLKDVLGGMAELTNVGIPAAEASTYLRQMIIALEAPSSGAVTALKKIGITTDELAAHMKKGLPDALQFIEKQLESHGIKPGTAQYVASLREISGGTRQMQGMLNLMGPHLADFTDKVNKVGAAASTTGNKVTGWDLVQKNMNQQFDRAKEVAETLFIQLGQNLLPVMTRFFGFMADKGLPAIKNLVQWLTGTGNQLSWLRPILGVVAIAIGGALVAAFVAWAISAGAAAIATLAATWPILAVGALIALLIAGIILLVTHWKQVGQVMGWIGDRFGELFGHIGEFFGNVFGAIGAFFGNVFGAIGNVFGQIGKSVGNFFSMVGTLFQAGLRAIVNTVTAPFHAIVNLFQWLFNHNYYFHNLVVAIQHAFNNAKTFVMNLWTNVTNWLRAQWERIKADVMLAWVLVQAYIVKPVEQAYNAIVAKLTQAALWMLGKWNEIKGDAQTAWKHFTDLIGNAVSAAREKVNEVIAAIMKPVNDLGQKLFDAGKNMIQMLINGIKSMAGNVGHAAGDIAGQITKFLGFHSPTEEGPGATADEWMPNLIKMLSASLARSAPQLRTSSEMTAQVIATPFNASRPGSIAASPAGMGGGAGSGAITIVVQTNLDGRRVAQSVAQHLPGAIRNTTGRRNF